MTTAIAIPYWGCPETVEKAVRSALAQSIRDVAVVVVGDGQEPPLGQVRDDRLIVYTLPRNRGTYFARQLILAASPFPWHAPLDADDWLQTDHLERLAAMGGTAVVTGMLWMHTRERVYRYGGTPERRASYHVGRFATPRLVDIGGYNPAERIGQDSLTINIVGMTGPVVRSMHPTYHRLRRPESLTMSLATNHRSLERKAVKVRNAEVARNCRILRLSLPAIRRYRESLVPPEIADELAEHTERLRARLGQPVAA